MEAVKYVTKLFSDKMSGKNTYRPQLHAMLEYLREGDIVVVTELDRLGRNSNDLTTIVNEIHRKVATLQASSIPLIEGIEDANLFLKHCDGLLRFLEG